MMKKPTEITDAEWDSLTSPENYYRDGEVSPDVADRMFREQVQRLVDSRRQNGSGGTDDHVNAMLDRRVRAGYGRNQSHVLLKKIYTEHTGVNLVSALVYHDFAAETQARKFVQEHGGAPLPPRGATATTPPPRKKLQPTTAAAVSRLLRAELGTGFLVTALPRRKVMVQCGRSFRGLDAAARVLTGKEYSFSTNGQHITVSGRYV